MNCETKLLTRRDLAKALAVSTSTIKRLEATGRLKPVFVSERCPRYEPDAVRQIVHGTVAKGARS